MLSPGLMTPPDAASDSSTLRPSARRGVGWRAAGLALLPIDNPHVASDLRKVHRGVALSPVLLVRGDAAAGRPALIADGYHRVCASCHTDENTDVPVRIVALSAGVVPASAVPADRR